MPDFKSENPGTWFYYNPDKEEQGGVCLRELSSNENDRIERLTVKKKKKFKHGVAYDDEVVNETLAKKLRWDFCIVDWEKTSLDGVELECIADNKVKMMNVIDFVKFAADSLSELSESNKSLEETRLKNSESSSNGNSTNLTAKIA